MITVTRLFFQRIISDWNYQYQVWRTAVDWIVALYIVIPFSAGFIYYYLSWWRAVPGWLDYIPLNALSAIIVIFAWSGTIRIFVEGADQLFLLQRKVWMSRIIKYSLVYAVVYNLVVTLLLLTILAPLLLLHYGFSLISVVWLTVLVLLLKNCIGLGKQLIELRFKGWAKRMVKLIIFLVIGVYVRQSVALLLSRSGLFYLSMLVLLIILSKLLYQRAKLKGIFFEDVAREQTARLRLAKYMLQNAGTYVKRPRFSRKRPLLFRNSNLLFKKRNPVNGLVEMCLKYELRNEKDVEFYLKMVGVSILAILVFPPDYGWLLWFVFSIMISNVVWLFWQEVIKDPFVCLFHWLPESKIAAMSKAIFLMALPGQLILGVVVAAKTHSWLGGLVMVPVIVLTGYYIARKISLKS
ncbi:ABC transporter permease [Desulfosporosinus lacus]|uniref:ABC-2 type transport system permease protein n=1 Tax=Desulfosporosinus lacus DSM 15449 TaxID=1121420 RepID=A0A1M5ZSB5_9FIRM|nr:ABC transporter permease [Desulfosporosinus lacus]SHI27101.1 ABC-2 type transport system permease protein [Desulfosporosinus lacus DSM 15449]